MSLLRRALGFPANLLELFLAINLFAAVVLDRRQEDTAGPAALPGRL